MTYLKGDVPLQIIFYRNTGSYYLRQFKNGEHEIPCALGFEYISVNGYIYRMITDPQLLVQLYASQSVPVKYPDKEYLSIFSQKRMFP